MKLRHTPHKLMLLGAVIGSSHFLVADAAPKTTLKMNGKIASTKLKTIGGIVYVPVADVARALGQKVVSTASGLELTAASGTYQAGNLSGKVGDLIQTKKYSFQVLSVETSSSYASKYLKEPETFVPDGPEDILYVVNCRIKNTLNKPQGPVLATGVASNTAITDYDGQGYKALAYDSRIAKDYSGASMLPGAQNTFAVLFSVPKSAQVKDLVFAVIDYFDADFKGVDVRIALK